MRVGCVDGNIRRGFKRVFGIGAVGMLAGAITLAPLAAAGGVREEDRITNERTINRAELENLQRWVSSGHADWCKDARLVAAEELWRLALEEYDELRGIDRGLREAAEGNFATAEEVEATFAKYRKP